MTRSLQLKIFIHLNSIDFYQNTKQLIIVNLNAIYVKRSIIFEFYSKSFGKLLLLIKADQLIRRHLKIEHTANIATTI